MTTNPTNRQTTADTIRIIVDRLRIVQRGCTVRTVSVRDVIRVASAAARDGWAVADRREKLPSSYRYTAYGSLVECVRDGAWVLIDVGRQQCGSAGRLTSIDARWRPETVEARVARTREHMRADPLVVRVPVRRLASIAADPRGFPGAECSVRRPDGAWDLYGAAGDRIGTAWALDTTAAMRDPTNGLRLSYADSARARYYEHADTLAAALAERDAKTAAIERLLAERRAGERERRRERLLARVGSLTAGYSDARACGHCDAGIRAWAAARGIGIDALVPLRALIGDADRRAQAVALAVARRAIAARAAA